MNWLSATAATGVLAMSLIMACTGGDPTPATALEDAGCVGASCVDASTADTGSPTDDGGSPDASDACTGPCKGDVVWIRSFGSATGEVLNSTFVDEAGNLYISAQTSAALGIGDNGGAPVVPAGTFIAKFSPAGQPIWAKPITGIVPTHRIAARGGVLYVAGVYFKNNAQTTPIGWDTTPTGLPNNVGTSGYDVFVLKIDANSGAFQAAKPIGTDGYDELRGVGVATDGSPVIFGQMNQATSVDGKNVPAGPFVLGLTANLAASWVHAITPGSGASAQAAYLFPMAGSDLGVAGEYKGSVNFNDGNPSVSSTGTAGFVARLTSAGVMTGTNAFASLYAGDPNPPTYNIDLHGGAYGAMPSPAFAVVGRTEGVMGLGSGSFIPAMDAGARTPSTYVARYDATTMKVLASRVIFDNPTANVRKQVAMDGAGNISVAGTFSGTADLGGGSVTSRDNDGFVTLYDPQLKTVLWSFAFGGPLADRVVGMGTDPSGAVIVAGEFQGAADFPSNKQLVSQGGATNVFLMKLAR